MKYKIGFIGAGNMAKALIYGFIGSGAYGTKDILVYDADRDVTEDFSESGFRIASSETDVVINSTFVFMIDL